MLDQRETTVLGEQWVIQTLPSSQGLKTVIQIGHLIAGAAEGFGYADRIEDMPVNAAAIAAGVLKKLDGDATPAFIKRLVIDSVIKPKVTDDVYEAKFAGEYDALWGLVQAIIEHNHFADVLKKRLSSLMEDLFPEEKAKASQTST